jgi:hypothetical protein
MTVAQFLLFVLGSACAVHLLCIANFTPKNAPLTIIMELALGVGFSVGAAISALQGSSASCLQFFMLTAAATLSYGLDKHLRYGTDDSELFSNLFVAHTHQEK